MVVVVEAVASWEAAMEAIGEGKRECKIEISLLNGRISDNSPFQLNQLRYH